MKMYESIKTLYINPNYNLCEDVEIFEFRQTSDIDNKEIVTDIESISDVYHEASWRKFFKIEDLDTLFKKENKYYVLVKYTYNQTKHKEVTELVNINKEIDEKNKQIYHNILLKKRKIFQDYINEYNNYKILEVRESDRYSKRFDVYAYINNNKIVKYSSDKKYSLKQSKTDKYIIKFDNKFSYYFIKETRLSWGGFFEIIEKCKYLSKYDIPSSKVPQEFYSVTHKIKKTKLTAEIKYRDQIIRQIEIDLCKYLA